jgi:hypothetical protein
MFSMLVEYSAQDVRAAETVAGPSWSGLFSSNRMTQHIAQSRESNHYIL